MFDVFQSTVDKLIKKTNLALLIGTHSWREQFVEAVTVSAGPSHTFERVRYDSSEIGIHCMSHTEYISFPQQFSALIKHIMRLLFSSCSFNAPSQTLQQYSLKARAQLKMTFPSLWDFISSIKYRKEIV